jgi:hypothetical protein
MHTNNDLIRKDIYILKNKVQGFVYWDEEGKKTKFFFSIVGTQ